MPEQYQHRLSNNHNNCLEKGTTYGIIKMVIILNNVVSEEEYGTTRIIQSRALLQTESGRRSRGRERQHTDVEDAFGELLSGARLHNT